MNSVKYNSYMEKYVIKTNFRCLVEHNLQCVELDENSHIVIETEKKEHIKVYPLESKKDCYSIAYSFTLGKNIQRENLTIIKFTNHTEVILKEKLIAKKTYLLEKKTKNSISASVSNFPHTFEILYNNNLYNLCIENILENPNIEILTNTIKLTAKSDKGDYFCIFHLKETKFYEFNANEICFAENQFSVLNQLDNIAKHGKYEVYEINTNSVLQIKDDLIYIKNEPKKTPNENIIPFAFFEAVKEKDYNLARSYTSDALAQKLTDAHLVAYFGEIFAIQEYAENKISLITKDSDNEFFGKIFDVELINNEITNCYEI